MFRLRDRELALRDWSIRSLTSGILPQLQAHVVKLNTVQLER